MTFFTPLALRWQRAQQVDRAAIATLGHGWYVVPSSCQPTGYAVEVRLAAAELTESRSRPRAAGGRLEPRVRPESACVPLP